MIDLLDQEILKEVAKERFYPASISEILRPFRSQRAFSSLWNRVRDLEAQGLLKTSKQRHYVFVEITDEGLKAQTLKED